MKATMTYHASTDRCDRITTILTSIGVGEVVHEYTRMNPHGEVIQSITNTGVLISRIPETGKIITMYALTEQKLFQYWHFSGKTTRPPQYLINVVKNNMKKRAYLFEEFC